MTLDQLLSAVDTHQKQAFEQRKKERDEKRNTEPKPQRVERSSPPKTQAVARVRSTSVSSTSSRISSSPVAVSHELSTVEGRFTIIPYSREPFGFNVKLMVETVLGTIFSGSKLSAHNFSARQINAIDNLIEQSKINELTGDVSITMGNGCTFNVVVGEKSVSVDTYAAIQQVVAEFIGEDLTSFFKHLSRTNDIKICRASIMNWQLLCLLAYDITTEPIIRLMARTMGMELAGLAVITQPAVVEYFLSSIDSDIGASDFVQMASFYGTPTIRNMNMVGKRVTIRQNYVRVGNSQPLSMKKFTQ
jgi:hypothetical protein